MANTSCPGGHMKTQNQIDELCCGHKVICPPKSHCSIIFDCNIIIIPCASVLKKILSFKQ